MTTDSPNPPTQPLTSPIALPLNRLTLGQRAIYAIVLGALVALGPFTVDLYLPAFPTIADQLRATDFQVQLTLAATTVGFGLGQLLVGPLSDVVGRRLPLMIATALHVVSSLAVMGAPCVELIAVGRVFQGLGAAGGAVVAMAMVRDLFSGQGLVRMLSRLALVSGLAPILAPVIGSQLLQVLDWRQLFLALAGYGVLVVVLVALLIQETLPRHRRRREGHSTARERYGALFRDRIFLGLALIGAMNFASLFSYVTSSSFLLQEVFRFDAQQFGFAFAVNSIGLVVASQSASRVMRRLAPQWVLAIGLSVHLLAAAAIVVGALLGLGIWWLLVPLFFLLSAAGFTFPTVQVLALAHHGAEAGTAASVLGAANFALAGVIAPIAGWVGLTSALPMGLVMLGCLLVAQASLWLIVRPRTVPPIGD
ncbi:MAG: multidrug effflux MFS transporter [Actinomycetales bacterium]|nr:multidrug effflux MFS transporter [Actinomycetales bacterium]